MQEGLFKICMITDDQYCFYTGVALSSLKKNKNSKSCYKIYLICDGVSEDNKRRIRQLQAEDFELVLIETDLLKAIKQQYKDLLTIEHISATSTSLYKFMLPELLSEEDSVLYMDGDVLVQKDLAPLYQVDLTGKYAYVTPEFLPVNGEPPFFCGRLHINHKVYFQSGLMYLNLHQMRLDDLSKKLLEYRIHGINYLMDQDAFNVIFGENVGYYPSSLFPSYWELYFHCVFRKKFHPNSQRRAFFEKYSIHSERKVLKQALIIHFPGFIKPWKKKLPGMTSVYSRYLKHSPFADIQIHPVGYFSQFTSLLYEAISRTALWKALKKKRSEEK